MKTGGSALCNAPSTRRRIRSERYPIGAKSENFTQGGIAMKTRMIQIGSLFLFVALFSLSAAIPQAAAKDVRIGVLMPLTGYITFFGKMQETALKMAQKEFQKMGPAAGFDLKFI